MTQNNYFNNIEDRNIHKNNDILKRSEIIYSSINTLSESFFSNRRLPLIKMNGPKDGPVIWLTGCIHGDEIGGIAVIQEVFKYLKKTGLLCGVVYAFPLMNPIGFETSSRSISPNEEDLNRSFPGDKEGTPAERIANTIFSFIKNTSPTMVLDLHNDWVNSIPHVLIDPYPGVKHKDAYDKLKLYSAQLGFVVINEAEDDSDSEKLKKSLSGSLLANDIPALTIELGGKYIINKKEIEDGINSILNILSFFDMIPPREKVFTSETGTILKNKILKYSHRPLCPTSGIVRFLVKQGDIVNKGQPIARIYDIFGRSKETMFAQRDCLILGLSDSSVALPGLPVISMGIMR